MPVEIRELQINVTVNQQKAGTPSNAPESGPYTKNEDKTNLINQCIEQVMEIMSNKKER
jgi:hypothetical protein